MPSGSPSAAAYANLAADLVRAYEEQDADALARVSAHYGLALTFDDLWAEIWRRVYAVRQRIGRGEGKRLTIEEARLVVAQNAGFPSWDRLLRSLETGEAGVPAHAVDARRSRVRILRPPSLADWDAIVAVIEEQDIRGLDANGTATDDALEKLATAVP